MTPARNRPAIILTLVLTALGFGGAAYWKHGRAQQKQQPEPFNIGSIFMTDTSRKIEEPCPQDAITFFIIGQSHAANSMRPRTSAESNPQLLNYFNGKCYRLSDPILGPSDFFGSLWPDFADDLYQHVKKPIIIMDYALNGTSAGEWLPGEKTIGLMDRAIREAKLYTGQGGKIDYIVFDQGQRDAMDKTPAETYTEQLIQIFDYLQTEIPGDQTFLIHSQSWCTAYNPPEPYIIEAQAQFAASRDDTVVFFNSDTLDDSYRHDQCHFNGKGRAVIAQKLVEAVLEKEQKD